MFTLLIRWRRHSSWHTKWKFHIVFTKIKSSKNISVKSNLVSYLRGTDKKDTWSFDGVGPVKSGHPNRVFRFSVKPIKSVGIFWNGENLWKR